MRYALLGSVLALAALAVANTSLAQTSAQSGKVPVATAKPDFSGIWLYAGENKGGGGYNRKYTVEDAPLQPSALETYKANRMGLKDPRAKGIDTRDPGNFCFPAGLTRVMLGYPNPFEIIQLSNKVVIFDEISSMMRQIFTDGRGHPEGWPFGWLGHSIGKWDGDVLVVDTVSLNDRNWLDLAGTPHSDAFHVVERFRRVDHDTMQIDFTFEDPKAFTKTWGAKRVYRLRPDLELLERVLCEENLQIGKHKEGY